MIVRKFMADLLKFTKKIAQKIKYYDAVANFTDESHWYNPFFKENDIMVIWTDKPKNLRRIT